MTTPSLRRPEAALFFALLALLAWDASGLDLVAMRLVGDANGFAWREAWLTKELIHEGGRMLSFAVLGFMILLNALPRLVLPALTRRERLWWLVVALLCVALISGLKRATLTSCPWDLAEFGGAAAYVSHWRFWRPDGGGGHCFPSGHASAAFAQLAGGFALARAYPRAARAWWAAVIALGAVYGLGQMVRGAHYPSHTLWTAWLCWALCLAAARLGLPRASTKAEGDPQS